MCFAEVVVNDDNAMRNSSLVYGNLGNVRNFVLFNLKSDKSKILKQNINS